jgi:hypothetical protein
MLFTKVLKKTVPASEKIAPPSAPLPTALFPTKVLLSTDTTELKIAPPTDSDTESNALLFENVLFSMSTPKAEIAPPLVAVLPENELFTTVTAELLCAPDEMAPPSLWKLELSMNVEFATSTNP